MRRGFGDFSIFFFAWRAGVVPGGRDGGMGRGGGESNVAYDYAVYVFDFSKIFSRDGWEGKVICTNSSLV